MVGAVTEPIRAAPPPPNRLAVARRETNIGDGGDETRYTSATASRQEDDLTRRTPALSTKQVKQT
ncbi:hypothetical protein GCM10010187_42720 [Actinomadura coerulea]|nr:hypothetical protein GCM10010187_42720 [Actinomadura coerulea]